MKFINQDKLKKILSLVLLIFWCFLIFFFSSQTGSDSTNSSHRVIDFLNKVLNIFNPSLDMMDYKYTVLIIRKLAHMFLYFVLYYLAYFCFYRFKLSKKKYFAILFCFLYAVSDEIHQLFVPFRSGLVTDVMVDMVGVFLAYFFLYLKNKFVKTCKKN